MTYENAMPTPSTAYHGVTHEPSHNSPIAAPTTASTIAKLSRSGIGMSAGAA